MTAAAKFDEIDTGYAEEGSGETGQQSGETGNDRDLPGRGSFVPFAPETTVYDEPLRKLETEMSQCTDASKLKNLAKTCATIKGYRNRELISRKYSGHLTMSQKQSSVSQQ